MNILFDLDGTLIDSMPGISKSLQYALHQMGLPEPRTEDLLWCIGPPLAESMKRLLGPDQQHRLDEGVRLYRTRYAESGLHENTLYPGIENTLKGLNAAGHRLFVATAKPTVFARPILEHRGMSPWFEGIHGSELDGRFGKKGALITHILGLYGLKPSETLMIGDREHDILGARENQMDSIGVLWGYGSREELQTAGASRVVATAQELFQALS
jgi:phosphoglycolate phosphatase